MIGLVPVEAAAARDQNLLVMEKVERELLVIRDIELFHVNLREDVERRLGLHGRDAVDLVERAPDEVALVADAAARTHIRLDALVSAKRRLHDGLRRHVRAKAHVREHVHAQDEVAHAAKVARQNHPADTVARDHVALRKAGEGHARQVRGKRRDGGVLDAVHAQTIIDLVREDHELVTAGDINDFLEHLARIDGAGGVVRVNDDDGLSAARNLGLHVGDVRHPLGLLVADIVNRIAAGKRGTGGPQRIVGAGDEDLVAVIKQGVHGQLDELGNAVAGIDVLHVHVGQALELRILHDRLASGEQAARVRVTLALGELLAHVLHDLVGRAEAERRRVADVELENSLALRLHACRLVNDRATDVIEHVVELVGLLELAHEDAPFI